MGLGDPLAGGQRKRRRGGQVEEKIGIDHANIYADYSAFKCPKWAPVAC